MLPSGLYRRRELCVCVERETFGTRVCLKEAQGLWPCLASRGRYSDLYRDSMKSWRQSLNNKTRTNSHRADEGDFFFIHPTESKKNVKLPKLAPFIWLWKCSLSLFLSLSLVYERLTVARSSWPFIYIYTGRVVDGSYSIYSSNRVPPNKSDQ